MKRVFVVGLTGTVGSGKTTVAKLFEACGAARFDCDQIVHELYRKDRSLIRALARTFGRGVLRSGRVSRKALAGRVFKDPRCRRALERLVHPRVRRVLARELAQVRRRVKGRPSGPRRDAVAPAAVAVVEVPLLFESGFDRFCDTTVAVVAPARIAARRVQARSASQGAELKSRLSAQLSARAKAGRADRVIANDGSRRDLARNVKRLYKRYECCLR